MDIYYLKHKGNGFIERILDRKSSFPDFTDYLINGYPVININAQYIFTLSGNKEQVVSIPKNEDLVDGFAPAYSEQELNLIELGTIQKNGEIELAADLDLTKLEDKYTPVSYIYEPVLELYPFKKISTLSDDVDFYMLTPETIHAYVVSILDSEAKRLGLTLEPHWINKSYALKRINLLDTDTVKETILNGASVAKDGLIISEQTIYTSSIKDYKESSFYSKEELTEYLDELKLIIKDSITATIHILDKEGNK